MTSLEGASIVSSLRCFPYHVLECDIRVCGIVLFQKTFFAAAICYLITSQLVSVREALCYSIKSVVIDDYPGVAMIRCSS